MLLNIKNVKAKVDFGSKKAEIEFDENKTSLEAIKKEIEKSGYKVN
ncbi:MAG: heavy-metal-associated domain-containing protein, partial [Thaumarchaeota archaeon]|nr:heavy-metal-associated domain-containing protein [Nitrososphaerota archaeon]